MWCVSCSSEMLPDALPPTWQNSMRATSCSSIAFSMTSSSASRSDSALWARSVANWVCRLRRDCCSDACSSSRHKLSQEWTPGEGSPRLSSTLHRGCGQFDPLKGFFFLCQKHLTKSKTADSTSLLEVKGLDVLLDLFQWMLDCWMLTFSTTNFLHVYFSLYLKCRTVNPKPEYSKNNSS